MLTIVCGEDTVASRSYFQSVRDQYRKQGYELKSVPGSEVETLSRWLAESPSLFNPKIAYFSEKLFRTLKMKKRKELYAEVDALAKDPSIEWIDWEDGLTSRDITTLKNHTIKEFKPSVSIFQYLESCYPGNLARFVKEGDALLQTSEEGFLFAMLARHIRTLLLIRTGATPPGMAPWQAGKLRGQANRWTEEKLASFYEGMARIDVSLKSSANIHGIKNSIDILACYYL